MYKALKNGIAALLMGATLVGGIAATPAHADRRDDRRDDRRHERRDDRREARRDMHEARRDYREARRDYRGNRRPGRVVYNYDYNRPDPRYDGYYANRYYRGGYAPVPVNRQTRIYRGSDDRYYCRRPDGTTGLIIGAAAGALLGDQIDRGRSSILGAVLGAGAGGLLGREIERGSATCR